eukprot:765735-Hanusia_phi.AAC.1
MSLRCMEAPLSPHKPALGDRAGLQQRSHSQLSSCSQQKTSSKRTRNAASCCPSSTVQTAIRCYRSPALTHGRHVPPPFPSLLASPDPDHLVAEAPNTLYKALFCHLLIYNTLASQKQQLREDKRHGVQLRGKENMAARSSSTPLPRSPPAHAARTDKALPPCR